MTRKDLAALLGISGSMVTRLANRGMPTDSQERAQRWRKRHLETARIRAIGSIRTKPRRQGLPRITLWCNRVRLWCEQLPR